MGPSINGVLSGWTSASLAPKTNNLPISPAATPKASNVVTPGGPSTNGPAQYNLKASDYGLGGAEAQKSTRNQRTPLENLLAAMFPEQDVAPESDPFADPLTQQAPPTAFELILAGLGQRGSNASAGSSRSSNSVSPAVSGNGAAVAATIPGAPPFLAGAINGTQPRPPGGGGGGGYDPLIGLSAISAEQRIQKAQHDADIAKAQAKWHASSVEQEQMRADQANLDRMRGGWSSPSGFGALSGWQSPTGGGKSPDRFWGS